jgi:hypothetical protein
MYGCEEEQAIRLLEEEDNMLQNESKSSNLSALVDGTLSGAVYGTEFNLYCSASVRNNVPFSCTIKGVLGLRDKGCTVFPCTIDSACRNLNDRRRKPDNNIQHPLLVHGKIL